MSEKQIHFEEFLYLPALTHEAVIIAWGGFFFEVETHQGKEKWELLEVDKVAQRVPRLKGVKELIGQNSKPYGTQARVEITQENGDPIIVHVTGANCAVVTGLKPNTSYKYRVFVTQDGTERQWGTGTLRDWVIEDGEGAMQPGKSYENTFRTFPDPLASTPAFSFLVIGDFGRGIRKADKDERCQRQVAEAMTMAARVNDVRFMMTTGDNIYAKTFLGIPTGKDSGDEDDDWFFTYFQPYRYLLNRIPVFPAVGNHDEEENEKSIDRQQIYDNLYLQTQFNQLRSKQDCSMEFGLFYRFGFGRDAEFICLDTSKSKSGKRYFDLPDNAPFIQHCLADSAPAWRIVYSHHPAYCAGPRHESSLSLRRLLTEHPEVRVSFSGHEHNFQYARDGAQHHFLTGGGGKYRAEKLSSDRLTDNKCEFWGGNDEGHFLMVNIRDNKQMEVHPYGFLKNQKLNRIALNPAHGDPFLILQ